MSEPKRSLYPWEVELLNTERRLWVKARTGEWVRRYLMFNGPSSVYEMFNEYKQYILAAKEAGYLKKTRKMPTFSSFAHFIYKLRKAGFIRKLTDDEMRKMGIDQTPLMRGGSPSYFPRSYVTITPLGMRADSWLNVYHRMRRGEL
ncbi:hypothetical protein [Candidatus Methanodesulfokora washburnensis]|uniref:Uncharacterized protein n=1 Tax=Candidatus Methanodesulfokora washburnensis TaxID=2478471 RepID=A0A429GD43_9CREN|nr:hypothetical protein [Candidatus Methanodesulfokores washburnensis]RSN71642.1 hypothetical protein D6D85_15650 [Candidatus Methanodesulfokores washburnensis]